MINDIEHLALCLFETAVSFMVKCFFIYFTLFKTYFFFKARVDHTLIQRFYKPVVGGNYKSKTITIDNGRSALPSQFIHDEIK